MRANDHRRSREDANPITSNPKMIRAQNQPAGARTQDNQRPSGERYKTRISCCIRASFLNEYG